MCTVRKPPSSLKHKSAASQETILGHCTFSVCWQWLPYIHSQMCSRCHRFLNELCKSTSRLGSTQESLFYLFQQRDKQICCYLLPQGVTFCQTWSKLKAAEAEFTTNVTVHSLCIHLPFWTRQLSFHRSSNASLACHLIPFFQSWNDPAWRVGNWIDSRVERWVMKREGALGEAHTLNWFKLLFSVLWGRDSTRSYSTLAIFESKHFRLF